MAKKSLFWVTCGVVAVSAAVVGYVYREVIGEKAGALKGHIAEKMKRNHTPEPEPEPQAETGNVSDAPMQ